MTKEADIADPQHTPRKRSMRSRVLLGIVGLCLFLWSTKAVRHAMQPKYQGKTAEEWFATIDPYDHSPTATGDSMLIKHDDPAILAFQHFGSDAAEFLWQELYHQDSKAKAWLINQIRIASRNRWIIDTADGRNFKARMALQAMGPKADCLIPELLLSARSTDNQECYRSLDLIGEIGTRTDVTVPFLVSNLKSSDRAIVRRSMESLLKIGPAASNALPAMEQMLNTSTGEAHLTAAAAMVALGDRTKLDLLLTELQDTNSTLRTYALFRLGSLKTNAVETLPTLVAVAKDPATPGNLQNMTVSLIDYISPGAAKAAGLKP